MRKKKTTTRMTKMMTLSFIQSTKFQIALILVSWLRLHFLSKLIPQKLINVLLTVTFRLENILFRTVSAIPVANCIPMLVLFSIQRMILAFTRYSIPFSIPWSPEKSLQLISIFRQDQGFSKNSQPKKNRPKKHKKSTQNLIY